MHDGGELVFERLNSRCDDRDIKRDVQIVRQGVVILAWENSGSGVAQPLPDAFNRLYRRDMKILPQLDTTSLAVVGMKTLPRDWRSLWIVYVEGHHHRVWINP